MRVCVYPLICVCVCVHHLFIKVTERDWSLSWEKKKLIRDFSQSLHHTSTHSLFLFPASSFSNPYSFPPLSCSLFYPFYLSFPFFLFLMFSFPGFRSFLLRVTCWEQYGDSMKDRKGGRWWVKDAKRQKREGDKLAYIVHQTHHKQKCEHVAWGEITPRWNRNCWLAC